MSASAQFVWRRHPVSPKWHAFSPIDAVSACGLTTKAVGEAQTEVPSWPDACWRCCQVLGVQTSGTRASPSSKPAPEEMCVEFIGGRYDGIRVRDLKVVAEDASNFQIVGQGGYTIKTKPVEQPTTKEPWQA